MDLRAFYQKVRTLEKQLTSPHVVVVSLETPDGGKPGIKTEVSREAAAKLVTDNKARLATAEEMEEFHSGTRNKLRAHEEAMASQRLNVNIISEAELEALRDAARKPKA